MWAYFQSSGIRKRAASLGLKLAEDTVRAISGSTKELKLIKQAARLHGRSEINVNPEIARIKQYVQRKDFPLALSAIRSTEKLDGLSPCLEVLKAICLQLSEDGSLEEAKSALLRAIEFDDQYVEAYIELGWFYLNILNDAVTAAQTFKQASVLIQRLSGQVANGVIACNEELNARA
jgi:tetratricopeptide (TPR) repeat protein